ncbi:MAG: site-specific integrase [Rhodocyclaceae bacterium]|nr:site-specific integrase [Rhodocyclaceae bacterium]MCP5233638.1 site-specific integrase [Zoogloeaceae bacterium]
MAYIQKRKGKSGTTYRVQIRVKGHPPESASFERLTDARRWAAETESAIKAGRHFGVARRRSFDDLADTYGAAIDGELKSADGRRGHLARWREEFAGLSIEEITPSSIAAARDKIAREETARGTLRTSATINRYLATLSCAFTYAIRDLEWTDRNPVQRVRKGKEAAGRVRFLSDQERDRLLAECKASSNPHLYLAVVLALSTGSRQSEVMGLRWPQVDFERRTIRLLDGTTKNGHGRVLPLTGEAFSMLQDRAKVRDLHDDRVFIVPATGKAFGSLRTAWEAALRRADVKDFRWHDLRHTAASYLMMCGVSSMEVAKILGHRTLEMTARYSHLSPERTVELGDVLSRRLGLGGDGS